MTYCRRTLSLVTIGIAVVLLAGGAWWRLRPAATGGAAARAVELEGEANVDLSNAVDAAFSTDIPEPVQGAAVVRDTLWVSVNAAGRAAAVLRATLQAQVAGVVEGVVVRENTVVAGGAPLLQIDTTEYALGVAVAESDLRLASADYHPA